MNYNEAKIYHPVTLQEYSLYEADGQELLRQLLKSYSLYGGGKKKETHNNTIYTILVEELIIMIF